MESSLNLAKEATSNKGPESRRMRRKARLHAQLAELAPGLRDATDISFDGPMLRTGEVALLFGVSERCIRNWADAGKLPSVRTLGRHRLFPAREIAEILQDSISIAGTTSKDE